ncbi:ATP-grasp domain-containing protein [Methanobrevibacter sp.]|uniref:ATP-grasp domain-containing protein n=1 Tax=Methanobrevibacter sp. TaxID=66852 RepID=UPI00388FD1A0
MRNIVVVECMSTSRNFVEDITNMGCHPVVLETSSADTEEARIYTEGMREGYSKIKQEFELIYEQDTYEETLEMVRKYNPLLVLPGSEKGVILATKLANDLNLLCNPIENIDAMTLKHEMHNRLAEFGIRSIKGKKVTTIEDTIDFYESEGLKDVVIKPVYSAGSSSVRICSNKDELINAFKLLSTKTNYYGDKNEEFLVQERINGEEYIVNTVSCDGVPRVTLVWKYNKIKTSDGAIVYESCETINGLGLGEAEMIEYAYKVAEALGIKYGPVHGEYMIDDKGPVLIEVNCRPVGGGMDIEFLDRIAGHHETDCVLTSYLKPELFKQQLQEPYQLYAKGVMKFFIVPNDILASSSPMKNISIKLESHHKTLFADFDQGISKEFFKTEDLDSSPGTIYLVHENPSTVQHDLDFLRDVEKYAFSLVLNDESNDVGLKSDEEYVDDIKHIICDAEKYGIGLFVTDQFIEDINVLQVKFDEVNDIESNFDFIIINLNKSIVNTADEEIIKTLFDSSSKVNNNGFIFIPKNTYQLFNGGRKSIEALFKILNFKIMLPPYNLQDIVIASKNNAYPLYYLD